MKANYAFPLSFCYYKYKTKKRPVWSEASQGTETIQVESLLT